MRRRGFTVLELMVVCLVIGISFGMLMTVVAQLQNEVRKSSCLANLKQLATGAIQYSCNNRGMLPLEDRNLGENLIKPELFRGDSFVEMDLPPEVYTCAARPICQQVDGIWHGSQYDFGILNYETSFFYLANAYGTPYNSYVDTSDKAKVQPNRITDGLLPIFSDRVGYNAKRQEWGVNHQVELKGTSMFLAGANVIYLSGNGRWESAKTHHFPEVLLLDSGPDWGGCQAVHNPDRPEFQHRYWW